VYVILGTAHSYMHIYISDIPRGYCVNAIKAEARDILDVDDELEV